MSTASTSLNRSSRVNKTLYSLPVHCLSDEDIKMENERGVMYGFHRPENKNNRFMASLTAFEKSILRDLPRPEPYNTKLQGLYGGQSGSWSQHSRPASAPSAATHRQQRPHSSKGASSVIKQAMSTTTQKGVPCYTVEAVVAADIVDGRPATPEVKATEPWKVARVKSYAVDPSPYGYNEAGKLAFHQKYSWYKYHGFAGKGAKTSWASNPSKHIPVGSTSS